MVVSKTDAMLNSMANPPEKDNDTYYVLKDGVLNVRKRVKTSPSELPLLSREAVGNIMERSYRSKARRYPAPTPCKSPLELLRLRVGEQRKQKLEDDMKLQTLRDEIHNQQTNNRIHRTVEFLSEQQQALLASQQKAKTAEEERSRDRQQLEGRMKRHEMQVMFEKQREHEKKVRESQQYRNRLAEREQWRRDVAKERMEIERIVSNEDARRRREEYLNQVARKKQKQREEWEERQIELELKQKNKVNRRSQETVEEKKELSFFERKGRKLDKLRRMRSEAAHEVGRQVREQIEDKRQMKRQFQEAEKIESSGGGINDSFGNNTSCRAIPKIPDNRVRNYVAPALYRDHHGRTLYSWGHSG